MTEVASLTYKVAVRAATVVVQIQGRMTTENEEEDIKSVKVVWEAETAEVFYLDHNLQTLSPYVRFCEYSHLTPK